MATAPKFRIDVDIHDLLMNTAQAPAKPVLVKGKRLPDPVFPRFPEKLMDPGPAVLPERRSWSLPQTYRSMRGWLFPYIRSRVLRGDFHPITAYLFVEYKCNLDCWYCWSYNNQVKGMTEEVARRSIDFLYDHGCRVLALMGGEPLLRPDFAHKVVYYAAKKGFWVYIGTNGRLLRPEVTDRLGDAGVAVFNFAVDSWDEKPSLPKAVVPVQKYIEYIMKRQYVYGYMVFFNINICRNNTQDVRQITEYARAHRIATDYHINETPMLEQDEHFKHLNDNPTYIRPEGLAGNRLPGRLDHREEPGRLPDGELGAAPAGDQGLHPHGQRRRPEAPGLEWRRQRTQRRSGRPPGKYSGYRSGPERRVTIRGMELPRRPEQRHHPNRRNGRPLLPHVRRQL
jgi:pyruvate-formate lyase-activating enzyme